MITVADIQQHVAEEVGITHLPKEDQDKVTDELGGMLYKRMLMAIFDKLPPHEHEHLKQLIAQDAASEISDLVHKYIPDVGTVIEQELKTSMQEFRTVLGSEAQ